MWQILAVLFAALALSACGQADSGDTSQPPQLESGTSEPRATVETSPTEPSLAVPLQSGQADEANSSLPADFEAMLDSLGDHHLETSVSFEGRDQAGAPVTYEWKSRETVMTDPPSYRLDIETIGYNEQAGIEAMTLVQQGDTSYVYVPSVGCVSGRAGDMAADMRPPLEVASMLNGISGAHAVGTGIVVNGVRTAEFQLDETNVSWSSSGPWSVAGSAFVEEGSSVVNHVMLDVSGIGDLLGDGRILDGDYTILVDVTRSVAGESVAIPPACVESFRYPITPDAYDVTAIDDLLSFKSTQSLVDVVDFYLVEMARDGWQLVSDPDVFDDLATMSYRRDGTVLLIAIDYDVETGATSVLISP